MDEFLESALATLQPLASATRAVQEKAYLKSQLQFLGVGIPAIRAAAAQALKPREKPHKLPAARLQRITLDAWATDSHDARAQPAGSAARRGASVVGEVGAARCCSSPYWVTL